MARHAVLLSLALLISGACAASPSLQTCLTDAECGTGNLCTDAVCATNTPPEGDFALPAGATTNRLFDISPVLADPEGRAVTARWSVVATAGGCAPELSLPTGTDLEVVFWCAGTYQVALVPVDEQGIEGAAVVRTAVVTQVAGPTVVTGGTVDARCGCDTGGGDCYVLDPSGSTSLPLSTSAFPTVRWSLASGPDGTNDPLPIWFQPGEDVANPIVSITTGLWEPILGTWRFRVVVQDGFGNVGQAFQDVVVTGACTEI